MFDYLTTEEAKDLRAFHKHEVTWNNAYELSGCNHRARYYFERLNEEHKRYTLVSYQTPVAWLEMIEGAWYVTKLWNGKSRTTSKHFEAFMKAIKPYANPIKFNELVYLENTVLW